MSFLFNLTLIGRMGSICHQMQIGVSAIFTRFIGTSLLWFLFVLGVDIDFLLSNCCWIETRRLHPHFKFCSPEHITFMDVMHYEIFPSLRAILLSQCLGSQWRGARWALLCFYQANTLWSVVSKILLFTFRIDFCVCAWSAHSRYYLVFAWHPAISLPKLARNILECIYLYLITTWF